MSKHASYSQNISFLSEEIKQKIFVLFPELKSVIKKLNFQTQESYFNERTFHAEAVKKAEPQKFHPQDPRFKVLKMEAERLFADVSDPELKEIMISIFIQSR
jgi:hypothetical protein